MTVRAFSTGMWGTTVVLKDTEADLLRVAFAMIEAARS